MRVIEDSVAFHGPHRCAKVAGPNNAPPAGQGTVPLSADGVVGACPKHGISGSPPGKRSPYTPGEGNICPTCLGSSAHSGVKRHADAYSTYNTLQYTTEIYWVTAKIFRDLQSASTVGFGVLALQGSRKISEFWAHYDGFPLAEDHLDLLGPEILCEAVNICLLMRCHWDVVLIFSEAFNCWFYLSSPPTSHQINLPSIIMIVTYCNTLWTPNSFSINAHPPKHGMLWPSLTHSCIASPCFPAPALCALSCMGPKPAKKLQDPPGPQDLRNLAATSATRTRKLTRT